MLADGAPVTAVVEEGVSMRGNRVGRAPVRARARGRRNPVIWKSRQGQSMT
jgi:hypothetical protein